MPPLPPWVAARIASIPNVSDPPFPVWVIPPALVKVRLPELPPAVGASFLSLLLVPVEPSRFQVSAWVPLFPEGTLVAGNVTVIVPLLVTV